MTQTVVPLPTLSDLHKYVREHLCAHDRLEIFSTPFFAAEIKRAGRTCGYLFHIEGPRMLKNSALWTDEEHRIIFYDSIGTRYHEVRLSDSPAIEEKPRRAAA
ncbi:MAG: hypothetical protein K8T89_19535 [Planctomycetes bacterium]|nr:hypothetical protein [Planctomycetota bacterium]